MYGNIGAANTQIIGNVISGNGTGIGIDGASHDTLIAGNLIGTDATRGRGPARMCTASASAGTTTPSEVRPHRARNVISGNTNTGLIISGSTAANNVVMGNFIGTDRTGPPPSPTEMGW